jgi:cytochrome c556
MHTKFFSVGLALALGAGYALPAFSQAKPETLVKQRQAVMTLQGKYFGPLGGMAQGKVPYNADVVKRNAAFLNALDKMAWDGFTPATQNVKSRALPAIYSNAAKFKEAAESFQAAVSKLASVTNGGDEAAVKEQIRAVGKICGSCHDDFRAER